MGTSIKVKACVAFFGFAIIGLFILFINLLRSVEPSVETSGEVGSVDLEDNVYTEVYTHFSSVKEPTTESPKPRKHKPFGRRKMGNDIKTAWPGDKNRTMNIVIRIVDKNNKVLKTIQHSSKTIQLKNIDSTALSNDNDSTEISPLKGVRRSLDRENDKVPRIVLLKLFPNNTYVLEEDESEET